MSNEQIARAFSGHRFEEAFDHIADHAVWNLVGAEPLEGRAAIVDACRRSAEQLAATGTTWLRFVSTGDGDVVAVDAVGRYDDPDGVSTVSSCDVYEFAAGLVTAITTYAVELPSDG